MDLAQLIPESTPHCLIVLDEELRLIYGNRNFSKFVSENFGITIKKGQCVFELIPQGQRPVFVLKLRDILAGQSYRVEQTIEINGFTRHFDVTCQPLGNGKTYNQAVITFDEITSRKRREIRLLDEDEQLREALTTRETLLSVISHDLRSPIFQLNSLLFQIRQASESRDEARLQMHADDLEERITHLTHTLDNVLSWSGLQRQSMDPRVTVFPLKEVFKHAIGLLKPAASRKDLHVYTRGLRDIELSSDREMVAFVVRNLVNNAIKYSRQSGKIEVIVKEEPGLIRFLVRDFGVGVDPEQMDSVFKSNQYLSHSGTWGEQGTGLGLRLSYEFVGLLKGSLEIEPAEGDGTLVTVTLPQLS